MNPEIQKYIDDAINKLRTDLLRHTHNGFDSGRKLVKPIISQGIEIEAPVDPSIASFTILAGDGFGVSIDANVGAAIYGATVITGQGSSVTVGGTSTNGGITMEDGSGTASRTFAFSHSSNGIPYIETDAAIIIARVTTTARDALDGITNGMLIYNTSTGKFQGRAGGAWVDLH